MDSIQKMPLECLFVEEFVLGGTLEIVGMRTLELRNWNFLPVYVLSLFGPLDSHNTLLLASSGLDHECLIYLSILSVNDQKKFEKFI